MQRDGAVAVTPCANSSMFWQIRDLHAWETVLPDFACSLEQQQYAGPRKELDSSPDFLPPPPHRIFDANAHRGVVGFVGT